MQSLAALLWTSAAVGLVLSGLVAGLGVSFRLMRFPDLTVEGSFLLGASVWAASLLNGWNTVLASSAALISGAACGFLTATLSRLFGLDRFLAGILVSAACYSLALAALGAANVGLFETADPLFPGFAIQRSPLFWSALFAASNIALASIFFRSRLGICARAAAINPVLVEGVAGPSLPFLMAGLGLTNAMAAASGLVFAKLQGFVDVGMGQGILIAALASFAIGEAFVSRLPLSLVHQTVVAAAVGSVVYQTILNAALSVGVPSSMTRLASAIFVLILLVVHTRRGSFAEQPL